MKGRRRRFRVEKVFVNVVLNVWYKVNNLNEQMIYGQRHMLYLGVSLL